MGQVMQMKARCTNTNQLGQGLPGAEAEAKGLPAACRKTRAIRGQQQQQHQSQQQVAVLAGVEGREGEQQVVVEVVAVAPSH
jgi:hypothetical protein